MKKYYSLRNIFFLSLISVFLIIWSIVSFVVYRDAHKEIDKLFDSQMIETSKVLMEQGTHEFREMAYDDEIEITLPGLPIDSLYKAELIYQIWDNNGRLLFQSNNSLDKEPFIKNTSGFQTISKKNELWRVYSTWSNDKILNIQIAQAHSIRESLASKLSRRILWPVFIAIPILIILILLTVNIALKPLKKITSKVESQDPTQLKIIQDIKVPLEVQPLVDSLNALLGRLKKALENERKLTGFAAHELKTPIAAIKVQAQVAMGAKTDSDKNEALKKLDLALDRVSRLINQILLLSRLDSKDVLDSGETVNLYQIAQMVLSSEAPKAINKNMNISLNGVNTIIKGDALLLSTLCRNLIDNAIRYTPEKGTIEILTNDSDKYSELIVKDTGPGLKNENNVFERFSRGSNISEPGSGLGLAIVKRVAELHLAKLEIANRKDSSGLEIKVQIPKAIESYRPTTEF